MSLVQDINKIYAENPEEGYNAVAVLATLHKAFDLGIPFQTHPPLPTTQEILEASPDELAPDLKAIYEAYYHSATREHVFQFLGKAGLLARS